MDSYTITGASDWLMFAILFGGGFTIMHYIIGGAVKGWIKQVTASMKEITDRLDALVVSVSEREVAEYKLRVEILGQLSEVSKNFNLALDHAIDKVEDSRQEDLKDHIRKQEKEIDMIFADIRQHKIWTADAIKDCRTLMCPQLSRQAKSEKVKK
jgi:phosphate uptake regulator